MWMPEHKQIQKQNLSTLATALIFENPPAVLTLDHASMSFWVPSLVVSLQMPHIRALAKK
jgi:hypothetical protein